MDALRWSDKFITGLGEVDAQHERLVDLINSFGELSARCPEVPRVQLETVVDELEHHAATHFADEEALMDSVVDARFVSAHKASHAAFLRDVHSMRASNFLEAHDSSRALFRFLLHWLAFHMLGTDLQLARQVQRVRRGEAPESAYAAEVREVEGPETLLLGALDGLLRVIAQRNAELTEANRTLEARVAQRTAELQAMVETLRATQVKLVETEKLASVGQLAAGLAHEINNPLAYITANLSALGEHTRALLSVVEVAQQVAPRLPEAEREALRHAQEKADLDFVVEDLGHLLQETREGVKRVQAIVRNLKDFSHVDGEATIELELQAAVEATLKVLPAKHRAGVSFLTSFAPARVRCDAALVNQAVLNLVQNAAQSIQAREPPVGAVTLRTGVDGPFAFVEVEDTGVGMSADVLAHAFEPFFTTRPPGQGPGLGLSTAYNCARSHGGRLEARSAPGVGSTFRFLLPLAAG